MSKKVVSKCCLCCNLSCWLLIVLVVGGILALAFMVKQKNDQMEANAFCTRAHAEIARACAEKDDELEAAAQKLNHTENILFPPDDYTEMGELCHVTLNCARGIKCVEIRDSLDDMKICGFVHFYTSEFKECAQKLYEKRDEISCLGEIFNSKERTPEEACEAWKSSAPCMKESIKIACEDRLGVLQYKWSNRAEKADPLFCRENSVIFNTHNHSVHQHEHQHVHIGNQHH
ncbi:unnamed protein product [Caenorhabditis angaria]|uniref:T20D4.11-like domain-containing protein n=1 Tax=Caenorhabditis angaria TaxID=860376 RepID=A0A9P1IT37_9PELO|nr:unnamed protein product [Caenorhabditis angaria]